MKAAMISIQPKWCELIASGKKTVEVRKTRPKLETPFKVYIYCTTNKNGVYDLLEIHGTDGKIRNANSKVIGEFVCDKITSTVYWRLNGQTGRCAKQTEIEQKFPQLSCLTLDEIRGYAGDDKRAVYGWHISDLVIYDVPKELSEFYISDNAAIQSCKHREIVGQPEYKTAHNGWIKGSYICNVNGEPDWCTKCKTKPLKRPPQSWCYVEELK